MVSTTLMVLAHDPELLDSSVATYETVVLPSAYDPAGGPWMDTTEVQMSLAVAAAGVTGAEALPVHSAVVGEGQVIEGGVVSRTVTEESQVLVLPHWSVAVNVVVVFPRAKPGGGPDTLTALQTSLPFAFPASTAALRLPVHSATIGAGHWIVGVL